MTQNELIKFCISPSNREAIKLAYELIELRLGAEAILEWTMLAKDKEKIQISYKAQIYDREQFIADFKLDTSVFEHFMSSRGKEIEDRLKLCGFADS